MIARLKEVFKDHDAVLTHMTSTQMSHNIRKHAILGVLRVQMALRLSLRMDLIQKSFQKTAIYPHDLRVILSNSKTTIPHVEVMHILSCMDELVDIMRDRGNFLTEILIEWVLD